MPQAIFTQAAIKVVALFAGVPTGAVATSGIYLTAVKVTAAVLKFAAYASASMAASKLLAPSPPSASNEKVTIMLFT